MLFLEKALGAKLAQRRIARLEKLYGPQIGKTAENGNMTFRKATGNKTVTTGIKWNDKKIAEVHYEGDVVSGKAKKIVYNKDGDIVEVSHSRQATNYRRNVTENLETGEIDCRTFDATPQEYKVTHTYIDPKGRTTQTSKAVKIKGKSSPLEK